MTFSISMLIRYAEYCNDKCSYAEYRVLIVTVSVAWLSSIMNSVIAMSVAAPFYFYVNTTGHNST